MASYQQVDEQTPTGLVKGHAEPLAQLHYNAVGQLLQKKLGQQPANGTPLQTLDYQYNIRGWLTHLNLRWS